MAENPTEATDTPDNIETPETPDATPTARVQLTVTLAGGRKGYRGDIKTVPRTQAQNLARSGYAVILGETPGETVDPDELDTEPDDTPEQTETDTPDEPDAEPEQPEPAAETADVHVTMAARVLCLAQDPPIDPADVEPDKRGRVTKSRVVAHLAALDKAR